MIRKVNHMGFKRSILFTFSIIGLFFFSICGRNGKSIWNSQMAYLTIKPGESNLFFEENDLCINGWDKDGVTFFFIPSYIRLGCIDQGGSFIKLCYTDGNAVTKPILNEVRDYYVCYPDGSSVPWKVGFYSSENLYTIDIKLNGIDYYDIDHDNYSEAEMDMYSPGGRKVYSKNDIRIKGRGNGTWPTSSMGEKLPLQIKLPGKESLCGMKRTDKWALIANAGDKTKIRNKLAYDLAREMDMEYAIESDWVDLYVNGEYMGNYLLCHEPDIGTGDLDIGNITPYNNMFFESDTQIETASQKGYDYTLGSDNIPTGGYLIEKLLADQYATKRAGFVCNGSYFSIKSPDNASLDEVSYVQKMVYSVDKCIHGKSGSEQLSLIDIYSFSRQYLMAEIGLNADAGIASYYFYKKPNDSKLYAGPCWDFDGAFGAWSELKDYTASITDIYEHRTIDMPDGDPQIIPLDWDKILLKNDTYYEYVRAVFNNYISVYNEFISIRIDDYSNRIRKSVNMDYVRWNGYDEIENDKEINNSYKYLSFFLYNRINYLASIYGESISLFMPPVNEEITHKLNYLFPDGRKEELNVLDGTQLKEEDMPYYDKTKYDGWHVYENGKIHRLLTYYDPIYSDYTLILKEDEE